jgi:hypothetical protein
LLWGGVIGARERSLCAFASGFAAIIMHAGWSVGFWSVLLGAKMSLPWRNRPVPEAAR